MIVNILEKAIQTQFTGKIIIQSDRQVTWKLYFSGGNLFWVNGGYLPHRSWLRLLNYYYPSINLERVKPLILEKNESYQYFIFLQIKHQGNIAEKIRFQNVFLARMSEMFFDILQHSIHYQLKIDLENQSNYALLASGFQPSPQLFKLKDLWQKSKSFYILLKSIGANQISFNYAPQVLDRKKLQQCFSASTYQKYVLSFNGNLTLRDLEFNWNIDGIKLCSFLLPLVRYELISLSDIEDFPLNFQMSDYQQLIKA
jgi:hypothetical protein